jgi:hypothetical protein
LWLPAASCGCRLRLRLQMMTMIMTKATPQQRLLLPVLVSLPAHYMHRSCHHRSERRAQITAALSCCGKVRSVPEATLTHTHQIE